MRIWIRDHLPKLPWSVFLIHCHLKTSQIGHKPGTSDYQCAKLETENLVNQLSLGFTWYTFWYTFWLWYTELHRTTVPTVLTAWNFWYVEMSRTLFIFPWPGETQILAARESLESLERNSSYVPFFQIFQQVGNAILHSSARGMPRLCCKPNIATACHGMPRLHD